MNFYTKFLILPLIHLFTSIMPVKINAETTEQPYLIMNDLVHAGLFATFNAVLGAIDHYENGHFKSLKIDFNEGLYFDPSKGPNWWEYFFEPINIGVEKESKHYFTQTDISYLAMYFFQVNIYRSFALCQKYIRLKPDIEKELDLFVTENFSNHFVIGVHHRGTDKLIENPIVPYEKTYQALCEVINQLTPEQKEKLRIFVATDDQHFLTFISQRFPAIVFCHNFARSKDSTPLHASDTNFYSNNYQKGKEAVIDCFSLSKCHILIRPACSCLSFVSKCLNPYRQIIDLTG